MMKPRPYHHGDLRNALIDASAVLAERGGPDAITIRAAAREVGVTPTAAYRHFAGHDELVEAAKQRCLTLLAEAMRKRLAALEPEDDPIQATIAKLEAIGYGYVDFALAEPGLFRTAFCRGREHALAAGESGLPEWMATDTPHRMLVDLVDDLIGIGFLTEQQRIGAEIGAWSVVHGLAMLLIDGPLAVLAEPERTAVVNATLSGYTTSFWNAGHPNPT